MFFAAYRDPEFRHWHTRQPASEDQVREWFDHYHRAWAEETGASWAVTRDGEVLGRHDMHLHARVRGDEQPAG